MPNYAKRRKRRQEKEEKLVQGNKYIGIIVIISVVIASLQWEV